ncbi:DoxX family protein [Mesorhizobium microcysteis]|jgi:putative oxidoreductase|uniref:DoxX family protein n=1 Tax=Neoaquamicrobium microcysteis TaxID=2682781 RepID=A0A5D4GZP2_9HYPH|nr:DoxX family protein [Mesorhizobium microcysteis]TYR32020.1 DoxX family protein [Mesorhizobium microcysteis]
MSNDLVLLVARIFLVALFLASGIPMLFAPSGFAGYMGAIGLPAPMLVTWIVIAIKVLGGLAVLVGFQTRYAAYALAAFSVGSALLGHTNWADMNEFNNFFKNFAIAGGFLALSVAGPGALSVSKR